MNSPQLRRCVRRVAEGDGDVSRAFAICTASLQPKFLVPGTNRMTLKGLLRSSELAEQPEHASAMRQYEAQLARIRAHRDARSQLRGAANRPASLPTLADLYGLEVSPSTPSEARTWLQPLRHALEEVFACDTAYGDCKPEYPSAGHCFLASMMVQDLLGGCIVTAEVNKIPHYWVRVDGIDVDITGDQFNKPAVQAKRGPLYAKGSFFSRKPRRRMLESGNKKVMKLYDKLLKRVLPVLRKQGDEGIATRIGMMK